MSNARNLANLLGTGTTIPGTKMPTGSVIQTVQTKLTSTVSIGSIGIGAESGNVSGFTCDITPSSTSNKVLVIINEGTSMNLYFNRSADDNDANYASRMASAMILQEIKG